MARRASTSHSRDRIPVPRVRVSVPPLNTGLRDGSLESASHKAMPRVLGDFKILSLIARGDHGIVFTAQRLSTDERVALKVLSANRGQSDAPVHFSLSAAEAGALRSHPGILSFYAAGGHAGYRYIAQELVEGGRTLSDWFEQRRREGFVPPGYFREAAQLITQIADALHHAHSVGVTHLAVNPSNILLTDDMQPKLSGFGLARAENALALARIGGLAGAPHYLAPEQVASRRQKIDRRADIYSLGAVLYEMLTFERPFEGSSNQEILKKILVREPASPRRLNPDIPRDLAVIALKAMEKDPRHRYRTMADLDHDLRRYLSGDVILARPVGPAERIWKRVKGSPARSIRDILTAAAVFLVVVVAPWMIAQKEREKRMELEAALTTANFAAGSGALSDAVPGHEVPPGDISPGDVFQGGALAGDAMHGEAPQSHAAGRAVERVLAAVMMLPTGEEKDAGAARAEALQTAAQMIDESFADQPEIEASLRLTLGRAFYRLGRFDDARRHFRAALDLRRDALGVLHPDTLDAMDDLAALLWEQGDLSEAEELYAELVETRSIVLGPSHADTLRSRLNLALVVRELGRDPVSEAETSDPESPDGDGRPGPGGEAPDDDLRDLDSSSGFSGMDIRGVAACLHPESE